MAHHQSAKRRLRTNAKAAERNKHYRSMMKTAIKKVQTTAEKSAAEKELRNATSILDKLVGKGVIHRNQAANRKSHLAKHVNSLT
jgi:small subunit ribosomal protein S20